MIQIGIYIFKLKHRSDFALLTHAYKQYNNPFFSNHSLVKDIDTRISYVIDNINVKQLIDDGF